MIKDNRLCPFCLLHDEDKPCGAKWKPVACTASNCKGRHIQKLHDFLKDVFQEENQVHVVHGDDRWEESEEAWELVEEETMIVGTVQQEDDCSWQDASKLWGELDEETAVDAYQVGTCQNADEEPTKTGEEAAKQPSTSQREEAEIMESGWQAPGPDDLLLEGEEGEYFLELLMRKASPEGPKASQPRGGEEDSRGKTAPAKGKDKKKNRKKALKENKAAAESGTQREEKSGADPANDQGKQAAPDFLSNPEAKGRGLTTGSRAEEESVPRLKRTPRGECSGQKMPES